MSLTDVNERRMPQHYLVLKLRSVGRSSQAINGVFWEKLQTVNRVSTAVGTATNCTPFPAGNGVRSTNAISIPFLRFLLKIDCMKPVEPKNAF